MMTIVEPQQPTTRDLERAMEGVVYFAKRVNANDVKHAEFHTELNHLLDEWEIKKFRNRGLTLVHKTW